MYRDLVETTAVPVYLFSSRVFLFSFIFSLLSFLFYLFSFIFSLLSFLFYFQLSGIRALSGTGYLVVQYSKKQNKRFHERKCTLLYTQQHCIFEPNIFTPYKTKNLLNSIKFN
jgi:hypothetical protein